METVESLTCGIGLNRDFEIFASIWGINDLTLINVANDIKPIIANASKIRSNNRLNNN